MRLSRSWMLGIVFASAAWPLMVLGAMACDFVAGQPCVTPTGSLTIGIAFGVMSQIMMALAWADAVQKTLWNTVMTITSIPPIMTAIGIAGRHNEEIVALARSGHEASAILAAIGSGTVCAITMYVCGRLLCPRVAFSAI